MMMQLQAPTSGCRGGGVAIQVVILMIMIIVMIIKIMIMLEIKSNPDPNRRPSQSRLYRPTDSFEDLSVVTNDLQSSLGREKVIIKRSTFNINE